MRRLIISLLFIFSFAASFAQDARTVKFLGIPVDGSYHDFARAMVRQGWVSEPGRRFLGAIDGEPRVATVSYTDAGVDRVMVEYAVSVSEKQVKDAFNAFILRLHNDTGYEYDFGDTIPDETRVGYDITVRHKVFDASFYVRGSGKKGHVWFRIEEMEGGYQVVVYYDNLNNRPETKVL